MASSKEYLQFIIEQLYLFAIQYDIIEQCTKTSNKGYFDSKYFRWGFECSKGIWDVYIVLESNVGSKILILESDKFEFEPIEILTCQRLLYTVNKILQNP